MVSVTSVQSTRQESPGRSVLQEHDVCQELELAGCVADGLPWGNPHELFNHIHLITRPGGQHVSMVQCDMQGSPGG